MSSAAKGENKRGTDGAKRKKQKYGKKRRSHSGGGKAMTAAARLAAAQEEFEAYRAELLDVFMCKRPGGVSEKAWAKRFRPPSYTKWQEKKRLESVKVQLAWERKHNLLPPSERVVSLEHKVVPNHSSLPEMVVPLDLAKLSKELSVHTYLRGLLLPRCVLGDDGVRQLCEALKQCPAPLEHLCLRRNNLSDVGAGHVFSLLKEGRLRHLETVSCSFVCCCHCLHVLHLPLIIRLPSRCATVSTVYCKYFTVCSLD